MRDSDDHIPRMYLSRGDAPGRPLTWMFVLGALAIAYGVPALLIWLLGH